MDWLYSLLVEIELCESCLEPYLFAWATTSPCRFAFVSRNGDLPFS